MSEYAQQLIAENKAKHARGEDASYLDLGHCGLTGLPDLSKMDWLETLILSDRWGDFNNKTGQWDGLRSQNMGGLNRLNNVLLTNLELPRLKKLVASNLNISDGRFLERLYTLNTLYISSNQISDGSFLENLTNLTSLDLSSNQIKNGRFLENLRKLKTLNLNSNKISYWRFLEKLTNLRSLDIRDNEISDVWFLEKLTNLRSLDIRDNEISDGCFLKNLTGLTNLHLASNQISDGRFLENLTNLTSLDIGSNKISDAHFLENLTKLRMLSIRFNQISDAHFLENLTNLTSLDIGSNKISNAHFLENLTNLTELDISSNKISDGRFLENLTNLTSLDISYNKIRDGRFLKKLRRLTKIDLSNNQLEDLSPFLYFIQKKRMKVVLKEWYQTEESEINVKDNPLTNPPPEIVVQGTDAIIRYFKELQTIKAEDIRPLNEAKLIVIGQPRAGKTSLRYKLCDTEREMPQQDDSTRGIDIELQTFDYTDSAGAAQTFQYHIWDFGGQQIYHATHRFFLTKRTVYVAVVDTDVNDKQNDLDYWLHMIELIGDGSPVLLVQNQKNDRSIEISDTLRNRFRNILAAKDYELNLARLQKLDNPKFEKKKLSDFQRFKKDIQRIFEQQTPILMTPAKSDTRRALEQLSREKPVIELTQYKQLCIKNGLKDPLAQTDLLRTLHNLGICLWYEGYDFLERILILQNRWATDAVFKVLDNETVKKNKGHFRRTQLNQIWAAEEYQKRVSELVELMKQFKLCYQIGQTDEYIAPQLLDKNPPEDFSRTRIQKRSVRMLIEYEFMPRGIMTQFIVSMHRQISGGQRHAWETGFAVQSQHSPSAVGMAEESYDSRKLELWAQGPGAGLLLQQMLSELEKIHDSFNRLRYNKLIPCNCEQCSAPSASRVKEFDYDEILLEMYQNRQAGIRCSYGNQTVPFDQLLGVLGFTAQQTEDDFRKTRRGEPANTPKSDSEHHYHGTTYILQDQSKIETMLTNQPGGNPPNDTSNIYSYLSAVVVIAAVLFPAINVLPWGKSLLFGALLILLLVLVGALQLKNDEKLSEKGFVDLMLIILKKIPPLNWFGKK